MRASEVAGRSARWDSKAPVQPRVRNPVFLSPRSSSLSHCASAVRSASPFAHFRLASPSLPPPTVVLPCPLASTAGLAWPMSRQRLACLALAVGQQRFRRFKRFTHSRFSTDYRRPSHLLPLGISVPPHAVPLVEPPTLCRPGLSLAPRPVGAFSSTLLLPSLACRL